MLSFRQFLREVTKLDLMKTRLLPAWRNKKTGDLTIGRRGQMHGEMLGGRGNAYNRRTHDLGFYDPHTKRFHGRIINGHIVDATDLMTPVQRMRKFGTE